VRDLNLHHFASPERHYLAKDLDISFSKVKYLRIAPFVGLEPTLSLRDAPTCEIHRARLPDDFFKAIIGDIEMTMKHYGPPFDHPNAQMSSRFLSPASVQSYLPNSYSSCSCRFLIEQLLYLNS
jgi:hypothetical protein